MKREIRKILGCLIVIALLLSLFSCRKKNSSDGTADGGDIQEPSADGGDSGDTQAPSVDEGDSGNTPDAEGSGTITDNNLYIVFSNEVSSLLVFDFATEINNRLGVRTVVEEYSAEKEYGSNTIFVGDTALAISDKAYKKLDRIDIQDKEDKRYVIYGGSAGMALAFEKDGYGVNGAINTAFEEIISSYLSSDGKLMLKNGVMSSGIVNTVEYQRAKDKVTEDALYADLYESIVDKTGANYALANSIYEEILKIYALYTDDMISWLANLYCPDTGGFYYSNSARDNVGYLPDIESTAQMMDIVISSGLCSIAELPTWLKDNMVTFVKGLQDPNGYFYHPQWGKEATDANTSRRARDVSKAVSLLKRLGAQPTYDTPSGEKGDGIVVYKTPPSTVSLTAKLSRTKESAVSAVAAASFDYNSTYLESLESFSAWLETVDINSSSYQSYYVGDKFATLIGDIIARDNVLKKQGKGGLVEALTSWLGSKQNAKTGLWTLHAYADIDGVNGLFKILSVYNAMKVELPHPVEALQSTMAILNTVQPEEVIRVCDIFNIWNILAMVKDNVNAYSKSDSLKSEVNGFYSSLLENSVLGLQNTVRCLSVFLKPDGSMSYAPNQSASTSHGMNVAVPYTYEGDVNGTALGTVGTICDLMDILGLTYIPIYTRGDGIYFLSLLEDMGTIVKHEAPLGEAETFDDHELGEGCTLVTSSSISSSGGISIVKSPQRDGNSLLFKSVNDGYDYIYLPTDNSALSAKCFVVESDLRVSGCDTGAVAQLNIYSDVYMLSINVTDVDANGIVDSNDAVGLYETSTNNKANWILNNFGKVANVDEWFKLRIEYYPGDHDSVRIKIFVNDKLLAVTDTYFGRIDGSVGVPRTYYTSLRVVMPTTKNCDLYIDNLRVTKTEDEYVAEKTPEGDPVFGGAMINVDSPSRPEMLYGFEDAGALDKLLITENNGGALIDGGRLVLSGGARLGLPVNVRSAAANCTVFESDILIDNTVGTGATYEFLMRDALGNPILRLHLKVISEGGAKKLVLAEASSGKIGNYVSDFAAPIGEEFRLGIHYYKAEGVVLIYVDGKIVGSTDYLCSGAKGYRCTNFDFSDISAASVDSSISIDNVISERRISSYEDATSPELGEKVYDFVGGMPSDFVSSGKIAVSKGELALSEARAGDYVIIPLNRRSQTGNSVVFSTDLKLSEAGGGFVIEFMNVNGEIIYAYEISYDGTTYSIYEITEAKRYVSPIASFEAGSHRLTVEIYPDKDICELFIDGKCVAKSSLTYQMTPDDLTAISAKIIAAEACDVRFDNLRAEIYDKLYLASNGKLANSESASESYSFESSSTGSLPSPIYTDFYSSRASLSIKEREVYESVSKVLRFVTSDGNNDSLYIPVTKKMSGANGVAFEADMRLDMLTSKDGIEIYLQVGSTHATRVTLKYSGGKIAIYDNAGTINFNITVANSSWFNFRLEYSVTSNDYTGDGVADALVKLYINGTHVGTGYNSYDMTYTADRVTRARLYTHTSASFTTYLDNVKVEQFMMDVTPHEHSYSTEWESDNEGHWHNASCSSTPACSGATSEKTEHSYNSEGVCICGYEMPKPHEHEFSKDWCFDGSYHWHEAVCNDGAECESTKSDYTEHSFDDDGKCICGYSRPSYSENDGSEIVTNPDGWTKPHK